MSEISNESAIPSAEAGEQLVPPASLNRVPRELTPRARRRSWSELSVRMWVVLSVAVALITVGFTISKYLAGRYERWLITQGTPVEAKLMKIENASDPNKTYNRTDRLRAHLEFSFNGQQYREIPGWLAQLPDEPPPAPISPGQIITVRLDPENPLVWTDKSQPRSWPAQFTIVWLLLVPLLAILVLVALLRRTQVLGIWRKGELSPAVVVELKQTAVAPFSRIVRFTLADGSDRRVFATLHPAAAVPRPAELMWVIHPPAKPGKAIVAKLYE